MSRLNKFYFLCLLCFTITCTRLSEGEKIYKSTCSNCHMDDGQGVANLVPSIKSTKFINTRNQLICLMIKGALDSTSKFGMPSFDKMSNAQIANVLNYINTQQKFNGSFFNELEIETVRDSCAK